MSSGWRRLKNRRGRGNHLGNLGLAYATLGETCRAIEFYEQANRNWEGIMEFKEWWILLAIPTAVLVFQIVRTVFVRDRREMAVAEISGKEEWTTAQEMTVMNQISQDMVLQRIEAGLGLILLALILIIGEVI